MREFTGKLQERRRSLYGRQRSDIPATSASQLRAELASCTLLPDANFMLGSPALSNERAAPTKLGTGTTAWKTRNRSVLKGLLSVSCSGYLISGLKQDVGMIQPCARLGFAGEVPRAFFSGGIPVITQDAFHRNDTAEMALARRKITRILLRPISSRIS